MRLILWMQEAEDDLAGIHAYIGRDSQVRAQLVVRRILEATRRLVDFPSSGRIVPEKSDPAIREIFVYSYRVIDELFPDEVHILSVIHGARLLGRTRG